MWVSSGLVGWTVPFFDNLLSLLLSDCFFWCSQKVLMVKMKDKSKSKSAFKFLSVLSLASPWQEHSVCSLIFFVLPSFALKVFLFLKIENFQGTQNSALCDYLP